VKIVIIYFDNDGTYDEEAVNMPVLVNDKPIGFVSEVNRERITCYLWDIYVKTMHYLPNGSPYDTPKVHSISINC
jgi:hypothetical protein